MINSQSLLTQPALRARLRTRAQLSRRRLAMGAADRDRGSGAWHLRAGDCGAEPGANALSIVVTTLVILVVAGGMIALLL